MVNVGLTGGISCGKSTVLEIMCKKGAKVLDCDRVVHRLLLKGTGPYRRITSRFGRGILKGNGQIDRKTLRSVVLTHTKDLGFLERVLHPDVKRHVKQRIRDLRNTKGVLIVEVPLLFESGLNRVMDKTVSVTVTADRQRVFALRKGLSQHGLAQFSKRHWSQKRKAEHADWVIRNSGTKNALKEKTVKVFNAITENSIFVKRSS